MYRLVLSTLAVILPALPVRATSYYTIRPDDSRAVYLDKDGFPVHADGTGDDSDAVQQAIDKVQTTTRQGIVFIPDGNYRLSKTIYVWPGIRLIGYGAKRPVFILGRNTPGFQEGEGRYLIYFAGGRPRSAGQPPPDGSPGTFYSAMSNIDLEIEPGNAAAVGIRFHVAQHCYLAHMDLRIGSGRAALQDIGNVVEDLHISGGDYGIITGRSAPGWPLLLLDLTFEHQRVAAIKSREAGLTMVRNLFRSVPAAISVDPGFAEELWLSDSSLEDIPGPALQIGNENNARTQMNLENVTCRRVPVLAAFHESGKKVAGPGGDYVVRRFSHGLQFADVGAAPEIKTVLDAAAGITESQPSDVPVLPPCEDWVNVKTLGVKGDGQTDDTAALKQAISDHRILYLPMGWYRVTDTLTLKPDTVLIGLHPSMTVIHAPDLTPAFQGPGSPKALLETPRDGTNIVTGIGIYTDGINSRATAVKWMAGTHSLMDDVRLLGGHGTPSPDGSRVAVYDNDHTEDPNPARKWDSQYPSLWVTGGGGGTFKNIWTPSTFAQSGMQISGTSTPGRIYAMSIEHHVRNEVVIRDASNWKIYAMQFEEERGESPRALPLEISRSSSIQFANTFFYRVVSSYTPFPYAVKVAASRDIRFLNLHLYSNSKVSFDSAVYDATNKVELRSPEFAVLTISGKPLPRRTPKPSVVLAPGAKVEKLAAGFWNISGAAVGPGGDLYFADPHWQRIYRWSAQAGALDLVSDSPLEPVQLAFDKAGNLMVVSYGGKGTVYALRPGGTPDQIEFIKPVPSEPRPGMVPVLPAARWQHLEGFITDSTRRKEYHYISPDGSTFIAAGTDFADGATQWGVKLADVLRTFGLARAVPGFPFYVSNEYELKTWAFEVGSDGTLSRPRLFAEQGGESVAVDEAGRVYIAAGRIYVYDPSGRLMEDIEIPQRPTDILFGGRDGRTLFIAARDSLYSVRTRHPGLGLRQ
jgi:sugar lactone lactonase YvrE